MSGVFREPPEKMTRVPVALLERLDEMMKNIGAVQCSFGWDAVDELRAEVKARLLIAAECEQT
jgi:hypothetical protein